MPQLISSTSGRVDSHAGQPAQPPVDDPISPASRLRARRQRSLATLVASLAFLGIGAVPSATADVTGVAALPTGPSPVQQSGSQRLLIPAYFYPGVVPERGETISGRQKWIAMCDQIYGARLPGAIIVMNQDSGDFTVAKEDYKYVLSYCLARRHTVIGYVGTRIEPDDGYRLRPLADVKADIAAHYSQFPTIRGMFVDEMGTDPERKICPTCAMTNAGYYRAIYAYVKSKSSTATVVGNPGAAAATAWQVASPPSADILVLFEGTHSSFVGWSPPSWSSSPAWSASRFAHLVYGSPTTTATTSACNASAQRGAGYVFVTSSSNWKLPPSATMLHCPSLYRLPPVIGP